MLFNSFGFLLLYLPIVVVGYWLLARKDRPLASIAWLAIASYVFYLVGETVYPWMLAVSTLFNFGIGKQIARANDSWRKHWLIAGVVGNLAWLGIFKYCNFFMAQLAAIGAAPPENWTIVLPIGISFFTFTQIAYLADVHAKKTVSPDLLRYGLFVSYFPHLIAGPILHNKEMLSQFESPATGDRARNIYAGLAMLVIGLAKKVLLADPCGQVASGVFAADAGDPVFISAWVGAIAYSLQIYFDFSGYSDMAIGISRMLGIELPINFNSPYKASSIIDFWRRWHITLSRFLRDYLYIPLGGNRKGEARRFFNLFTTMLVGGFWHGAGWTFIIWGAMHGAAQTLNHGWRAIGKTRKLPRIPAFVGWLATLLFVIVAWVAFRAPVVSRAVDIWRGMAGLSGFAAPEVSLLKPLARFLGGPVPVTFGSMDLVTMGIAALIALLAPNSQELLHRFRIGLDSPGYAAHGHPARLAVAINWRSTVVLALLLGLALRQIGGYSEFIYFQF